MSDKRIFEVLRILKEKSNEDNKLTINEIRMYLSDKNYGSSRNTIKKDIDILMETGCNIKKKDVSNFIPKEIYYYNDRHYLIGINNEGNIRNYRIDRIAQISIGEFHLNEEKIDLKRYALKNFDMFGVDTVQQVVFEIKNTLINSVIEKFGEDINIHRCLENKEHFILNVAIGINRGLIRWILKQGAEIKVIYPESLIKDVKKEIEKIKKLYE